MKNQPSLYIVIALLVLAVALILSKCQQPWFPSMVSSDTVVVERSIILPPDTVYVDKIKAEIVYRKLFVYDTLRDTTYYVDTLITTKPFTAYMDTAVGCNKFKLEYRYPENTFNNLNFVSCPDTVIVRDTVTTTTMVDSKQAITYTGYGFVAGFILGMLGK